ncbi:amino acid ABC transporter membrane protein 2 (PAAT family) [Rhizobium subbaraonis]|uniref:Amino acid ABC transporter membrane protein 2 (PAAT family) n=1 Tax=Rhizobium subbaraonis TaxID=908946 RepID=A0A285U1C1_9HYPH|nr:amino acid ABC transporter permease [Rhizobium subbaraonis]SOC35750.1 amino acid ABC transporter membrane protein 2 (PAAT family) [Rhizobium subbaraonis]
MGIQEFTYLLQGLAWTLFLTAIGFAGGIFFGLVVALMRVSPSAWLRVPAICWIGLFQGTPLLMQLFVAYFGLPLIGFDLPAWGAVSVALTAHASAFLGEIWRGAIQAVPKGQSEAAQALGLHGVSRMFDVVLPQAFKLSLPATVGFLVQLLKGTSLAAIVGFIELARAGTIVSNQIYRPLLVFGVVGAMYFAMCWPLSLWGRTLERRMAAGQAK